jgi:uncharacterized Zn-binding protein involved in type VI secretion
MPPAARVGDPTGHPGLVLGPGVPTVLIGGLAAAVLGDLHSCAFPGSPPHPPSSVSTSSKSVFIGGRPAARMGDVAGCGAPIVGGMPTVIIGD